MKKTIFEFVITGGPCAGKTTCLSALEQALSNQGFFVIVVAETATEVISSGIKVGDLPVEDFQGLILDRSLNKEATILQAISAINAEKFAILYDRGILDNKAYMSKETFEKILAQRGLNEIDLRDKYDAVFHLVTAANGAEEFYTLSNNKARSETIEQAIVLDEKTQNSWVGHRHLRVLGNDCSFEEKVANLIKEAFCVIGLPLPIEIERKYLIERPDEQLLEDISASKQEILQTYLLSDDKNVERRIRQRGSNGKYSYFYTQKTTTEGIGRVEIERKITQEEYLKLLLEGQKMVRKDRYCFVYQNQYFELDIMPDWDYQALLEIELTQETQEVVIPKWLYVIEEVTDNKDYRNFNLAK